MKKNLFKIGMMIFILSSVLSCHNPETEKKLQMKIDSLQAHIDALKINVNAKMLDTNNIISTTDAAVLTSQFRTSGSFTIPQAWLFPTDELLDLINNTTDNPSDIYGLRFYAGVNSDGMMHLVVAPVGNDKNDILKYRLYDFAQICPIACSTANAIYDGSTTTQNGGCSKK